MTRPDRRRRKPVIRGGRIGRSIVKVTAWVIGAGALLAAVLGEWRSAGELGVIGVVLILALIWDRAARD